MNVLATFVICSPVLALVLVEAVHWARRRAQTSREWREIARDEGNYRLRQPSPPPDKDHP